jgi:hypothetical protein
MILRLLPEGFGVPAAAFGVIRFSACQNCFPASGEIPAAAPGSPTTA